MKCLTCGERGDTMRYFVLPANFIASNSYYLCKNHANLKYEWDDIYDEYGVRKKISYRLKEIYKQQSTELKEVE
jgi:hypothetical protein